MPQGMDTVIGERGVNISGGQKARISLARAVYSNSNIVLLDDPLSAVDPNIANLIFHECIMGELKNRIVVLVTHQLQFLDLCPKILLLGEKGNVVKIGSYSDILSTGFNIKDILDSYNQALKSNPNQTETKFEDEKKGYGRDLFQSQELLEPEDVQISSQRASLKREVKSESGDITRRVNPESQREMQTQIQLQPPKEEKLIVAEEKLSGNIRFEDYRNLFSYSMGAFSIFIYLFLSSLASGLQLAPSYILSKWTKLPFQEQQEESVYSYLLIGSILGFIVVAFVRGIVFLLMLLESTTKMHDSMAMHVIRSKILFFDSNPSGRVLTRFSKDMTILDVLLAPITVLVTNGALRTLSVVIVVSIVNPLLIVIALGCLYYMWATTQRGVGPMIEAQRFEQMYQGPINQSLTTVIQGMVTLRSYNKFSHFRNRFIDELERSANSTFGYIAVNRWIGIRLDFLCAVFGVFTAFLALAFKNTIDREYLTFSLQIITDVIVKFSLSVRMFAETQNMMTCSQRVYQYTQLEQEDELVKASDLKSLKVDGWPTRGQIELQNVSMAYSKGSRLAVKNLSVTIQAGMKVGIVGRTGAGKSSILQILFRLSECQAGSVLIDGVDIKTVGLHLLRQNVAYIPQAPFLIQGSVRENIDPFNEFTNQQVLDALKEVNLLDYINRSFENGIQTKVSESNSLFSLG
mmetsp:Transcript_19142/g.32631  ORF Transcript_19142/g.32631 Transcript_19142/m.32631 type:complete len:690 (+) Transcript_19142:1244-3313(+)